MKQRTVLEWTATEGVSTLTVEEERYIQVY